MKQNSGIEDKILGKCQAFCLKKVVIVMYLPQILLVLSKIDGFLTQIANSLGLIATKI